MKNMFKKMIIILVLVLVIITGVGCSKDAEGNSEKIGDNNESVVENGTIIKNSTRMEAAHTFVQAMIDKDEEVLEEINRSSGWDTGRLLRTKRFEEVAIDDFDFKETEWNSMVTVKLKSNPKVAHYLEFIEDDGRYYLVRMG